MSAAQLLIGIVGLTASICTFVLLRLPQYRREQYRGQAFSTARWSRLRSSWLCTLRYVWPQGRFESR
jgi:hypothetical protein